MARKRALDSEEVCWPKSQRPTPRRRRGKDALETIEVNTAPNHADDRLLEIAIAASTQASSFNNNL
jgi:hypothetical protein